MIGKVAIHRSGGYDPELGRRVIDPSLEPRRKKRPPLKGCCPECGADSKYPRFDKKHKPGCASGR